ncbi:MAG: 30S ribosomal protein S6 [bacterium]|nr:30S ribosomal protein S6 [bacterium]
MSKTKPSGASRYELLFVVPNQYTEDEAKAIVTKVEGYVTENGANIVYREYWGKKKLAYVIKQNHYGYYNLCEFDAERSEITKLDRTLRLSTEVLRHQIISVPALSDAERLKIKEKQEQATKTDKKEDKPVKEKSSKPAEKKEKVENKADLKDLDEKLEGLLDAKDLL